jgi:hypothetical protein
MLREITVKCTKCGSTKDVKSLDFTRKPVGSPEGWWWDICEKCGEYTQWIRKYTPIRFTIK